MAVVLIVAAGRGERLGSEQPKALVPLAGRPMVEWSVAHAREAGATVVVAMPDGFDAPAGTIRADGGRTRSHSVRNALAVAPEDDQVVVHDAARPLADAELFARTLAALEDSDAAIAAVRIVDTVKEADANGRVKRTLDRSLLWSVQTPQAFRREVLERALDVPDDILEAATDDAWLVERVGGSVRLVEASRANLKVTTVEDVRVAEAGLRSLAGST
ncbi:MAG: 2-C-methyl-D-erythritol 4-phosphate cytidylyltransferase [Solirubrobacteraceae bacterium]